MYVFIFNKNKNKYYDNSINKSALLNPTGKLENNNKKHKLLKIN